MTDERLEELERLCEAATPGPWEWSSRWGGWGLFHPRRGVLLVMDAVRWGLNGTVFRFRTQRNDVMYKATEQADFDKHPDAKFIAEARSAMPELVAEVRRLRTDAERYRWLRDNNACENGELCAMWYDYTKPNDEPTVLNGEELDAAIDAAMQGDSE